ncbi:MAG: NAD(P)/FAD-dependent oxidoreductase [Anaerolineae bacterium]
MQKLPTSCDVVVIGAGLTGALMARRLAEADRDVVVFEAQHEVAGGATGRGARLALLGTPLLYVDLIERWGEDRAAHLWELTRQNLEALSQVAAQHGIEMQRLGSLRPVENARAAERLLRSVTLLQQAGFEVRLEDATSLGMEVGLETHADLACDIVGLTQVLLDHPRIMVETGTEVKALEPEENEVKVWGKKRYLRSKVAVIAGGAHAVHLSDYLSGLMTAVPFQALECEAPESLERPLLLEEGQVLVQDVDGGWQMVACSGVPEVSSWDLLSGVVDRLCPETLVTARRSGWVARSADNLPLVGELPDLEQVYVIGGLGGWGMSWACVAVEQLAALLIEEQPLGILNLARFSLPPGG